MTTAIGWSGTTSVSGTLVSTADDRIDDIASGDMTTSDAADKQASDSDTEASISSLLSATFSDVFSYGASGSLSDTFSENGTDVTTDAGSNSTTDTDDLVSAATSEIQNYSDNLYGSSAESTSIPSRSAAMARW